MRRGALPIRVAAGLLLMAPPAMGFEERGFRAGYGRVLAAWAGGDRAQAVAALVELESGVLADASQEAVEPMWRAKLGVIRDLIAGEGLDLLAPVALLQEQAYLEHLRRRDPVLAAHARTMTAELLVFYAEKAAERESDLLAADLMASLAGHVQGASMISASTGYYRQALEIQPDNVAALIGLGATFEKLGEWERAAELLEGLTAADPDCREGRLRLAVNLLRLGRRDEAETHLRWLAETEDRDWVTAVAAQELARLLSIGGEDPAALELLERAVEEMPGEFALQVQLAYFEDRLGAAASRDLLGSLAETAEAVAEPSRRRYLQTPSAALEELRRELRRRDEALRPRLAAALDRLKLSGSRP